MQSGDVGSKRRSLGWKVEIWVRKGSATNTEILGKEKKSGDLGGKKRDLQQKCENLGGEMSGFGGIWGESFRIRDQKWGSAVKKVRVWGRKRRLTGKSGERVSKRGIL